MPTPVNDSLSISLTHTRAHAHSRHYHVEQVRHGLGPQRSIGRNLHEQRCSLNLFSLFSRPRSSPSPSLYPSFRRLLSPLSFSGVLSTGDAEQVVETMLADWETGASSRADDGQMQSVACHDLVSWLSAQAEAREAGPIVCHSAAYHNMRT